MTNDVLKQIFRARCIKLMDERGLNQTDLGKKAGLGRDLVSTYLRPNPRSLPEPANLLKIANALGVKTSELLPSFGDMEPAHVQPLEVIGQDATGYRVRINIPLPFEAFVELSQLVQRVSSAAS